MWDFLYVYIIALEDIEAETATIVRDMMDAFEHTFLDPVAKNTKDGDEVIIEQEEKIISEDGNVKIKQRTLRNPSQEELETKTLEELEDDVDDPVIYTILSF